MSSAQKRISMTLLAGAALIAAALLIRSYSIEGQATSAAEVAVVTQAPERVPIKTLDENNDGVPDWQEALLVTEALQIASTTSEYKEPETLTEQFALDFFQEMVRSKNYGAFGETNEELVLSASEALAKKAVDKLLTVSDISIADSDSLELQKTYTERLATIINTYSQEDGENEARILEQALRAQDPSELEKLDTIIFTYERYLEETKALQVPPSLASQHLDLLNSYRAILEDIKAMRTAFTDPMLTLLRMKRYQDDATGLYAAIINLYTQAMQNGVQWDTGSPVFTFITIGADTLNN